MMDFDLNTLNWKYIASGIGILIVVMSIWKGGIFTIGQQTNGIVERFGKFRKVWKPGLHFCIPYVNTLAARVNMRVCQLDVVVETKTKDSVFTSIKISVQYKVQEDNVYKAFYSLENHEAQITSYVFDVVRAEVPKMPLDDVFEKKNEIATSIKHELYESMLDYGFEIRQALVTDIDPNKQVKEAMNRINAAERNKVAAMSEGEAERIKIVAVARAESESKELQGKGIAAQRKAIALGLKESIEILKSTGVDPTEANNLLVITQHYDTLTTIGSKNNSSLLLLPSLPGQDYNQLSNFLAAQKMKDLNENSVDPFEVRKR